MPVPKKDRNQVDLVGEVTSEPARREFDSGAALMSFALRARTGGAETSVTENVPVAWWSPDLSPEDLAPGTRVRVVGRVHRRFYTGAGGLRSVVEVVATRVEA